jgi:hypothetical protein
MYAAFRALPQVTIYTDSWFITLFLFLLVVVTAEVSWSILIEVKLKFTLEQATKTHRGVEV